MNTPLALSNVPSLDDRNFPTLFTEESERRTMWKKHLSFHQHALASVDLHYAQVTPPSCNGQSLEHPHYQLLPVPTVGHSYQRTNTTVCIEAL